MLTINGRTIPRELIMEYMTIIRAMGIFRMSCPAEYEFLDKQRRELHNELLKAVGTTREDKNFELELALLTEELMV